ncbi:hypothetical protein RSAG8_05247, partial [Rhizoctonia solani AG-8 WAC10335]
MMLASVHRKDCIASNAPICKTPIIKLVPFVKAFIPIWELWFLRLVLDCIISAWVEG